MLSRYLSKKGLPFHSAWVKNEWSRYLKLKEEDNSRIIIPCFAKMNPYDLPEELSIFQSLDISKIGFMQDLTYSIKKILTPLSSAEKTKPDEIKPKVQATQTVQTEPLGPTVDSLYQRAVMFLEDGNFLSANMYFNRVLDIVPEYAPAYIGKACCYFEKKYVSLLNYIEASTLAENPDIKKAIRFADKDYKDRLEELDNKINKYNTEISNKYRAKKKISEERVKKRKDIVAIFANEDYGIGLKKDGTVVSKGENYEKQCEVYEWTDIVAIDVGKRHTVGLKKGGKVVATGDNSEGQCKVDEWANIVAIAAGEKHTVGIKRDGTVVATGYNVDGRCNVEKWENIVSIYGGKENTVGIKKDGTVVAVGDNSWGQNNVRRWSNIGFISMGDGYTVGIIKDNKELVIDGKDGDIKKVKGLNKILAAFKGGSNGIDPQKDGKVVAVGFNNVGQCNVKEWADIVKVVAGDRLTVGLKKNGTVVATGYDLDVRCNVEGWTDIIDIGMGRYNMPLTDLYPVTVGLKKNGTVVAVGSNKYGQCKVNDWTEIVAIAVGDRHIMGLKKDGTVVDSGWIHESIIND